MFCKHCGVSVEVNSRYCPACGKSLTTDDALEPIKKTRRWPKILMMILAVIILLIGWVFYITPDLTQTVEGQLTALRQNKISEAYYEYTSKEFQSVTSLEAFRQFLHAHPILLKARSLKIDEHRVEDDIGIIKGLLKADGEEEIVEFFLTNDGDRWKISRIELVSPAEEAPLKKSKFLSMAETMPKVENSQISPPSSDVQDEDAILENINLFLDRLKKNSPEESYKYVSKEFKNATPLSQFKVYIEKTPILTHFSTYSVESEKIQENEALVKTILDPAKGAIPMEFHLYKEDGTWKIWSFRVVLPSAEVPLSLQDPALLTPPIKGMFQLLQSKNNAEAYANYFSDSYKGRISLKDFNEVLNKDPLLAAQQMINIKESHIDGRMGKAVVDLSSKNQFESLEFTLQLENGKWKISGWKQIGNISTRNPEPVTAKELAKVVEDQIREIKSNNIQKAYSDYTSQGFKEVTSIQEFQEFLKNHPYYLTYQSLELPHLSFEGNIAVLSGILVANKEETYSLEYQFVKQNKEWKILHIDISLVNKQETAHGLEFSKALIGKKVDRQGLVIDPQTILKSDQSDIYVNLFIKNSVAGAKIQMKFEHLQSGSMIPPVSVTLNGSGDSVASFVFSAPIRGWPTGIYQLIATSSTGASQIYSFKVE